MGIKKFKVGTVQIKKDQSGPTISLGNYSRNPKYATTVELTVKDGEGNILAQTSGGYLQIVNPRKREGITEDQAAKIPAWVLNELFVVVEDKT